MAREREFEIYTGGVDAAAYRIDTRKVYRPGERLATDTRLALTFIRLC